MKAYGQRGTRGKVAMALAYFFLAGCNRPTKTEVSYDSDGNPIFMINDPDGISFVNLEDQKRAILLWRESLGQNVSDSAFSVTHRSSADSARNPTRVRTTFSSTWGNQDFDMKNAYLTVADRFGNETRFRHQSGEWRYRKK